MRKLLVFLVVLVAAAVGVDRVAAVLVANEAEKRLVDEGFGDPDVSVFGFPFLTQLADRRFDRVQVRSARLTVDQGEAADVDANLYDVRASRTGPVNVGRLSGRGRVPYDVVVAASDVPSLRLAAGADGQVQVSRTFEIAGRSVELVAEARLQARGNRLRIEPTSVGTADGTLDSRLLPRFLDRMALVYRIPDLPDGVSVDEVTPAAAGFDVLVSGSDVVVQRQ